MCVGALIHSRIARLVYGAPDPKTGAVDSCYPLLRQPQHNHQITVTAGVLWEACAAQLTAFFRERRKKKNQ
jgi:tRNA(adenine34) deaminase